MKFLVVDDSEVLAKLATMLLQQAGHEADFRVSPVVALNEAPRLKPDCILLDLMMPEMDGFELCKRLRGLPEMAGVRIIILSGKTYEFDKRRAMQLGADGYIVKPIKPETFITEVEAVLNKQAELRYWGVRGTLPVPGPQTLKYGGNTSCVTFTAPGEPLVIFDAGSGIKKLSDSLMASGSKRLNAKIFITHPHWDHINALPFFSPLYIPGNEIEILGPYQGDLHMQQILSFQMDSVYFPVTIRDFGAHVTFSDLREESVDVGRIRVDSVLLSHPGNCLGYRATYEGCSVCYITDNELFPKGSDHYHEEFEENLLRVIRGTDVLIIDTTYSDEEYRSKTGWGHSCVSEVARLAAEAEVKALHLFHHDPDQDDAAIDRKLSQVEARLQALGSPVQCIAPAEGSIHAL